MTIRPEFPLYAETTLPGLAFQAMRQVMLQEAREHDLPVLENTDTQVTLETAYGLCSFTAIDGGLTARVSAALPDRLYQLKESLVEHLAASSPDIASAVRWSDADKTGGRPPNFHFSTVVSVVPIGTSFVRVRIQLPDLSSFQDDAIHFRVVLPAQGAIDVEWPYIAENGSSVWPKGDKALHRPVYTTRWVDHTKGEMEFDVFLHEGGRVTDWARQVAPGDRVALTGPGGGGVPDTRTILMFADETGFPAVARILAALPADAVGQVTLLAESGADCAYPVGGPAGVALTWLCPADGKNLADLALGARQEFPDYFLWFACEKSDVLRIRAAYKADKSDPAKAYIAAYWTR